MGNVTCQTLARGLTIATILGVFGVAQAGTVLKFSRGNIQTQKISALSVADTSSRIWILQFKNIISKADQAALRKAGAKIYGYIPDDALIVRGSLDSIREVVGPKLQGFLPYNGNFKLSENLPVASLFSNDAQVTVSLTVVAADEVAGVLESLKNLDSSARVLQGEGRFLDVSLKAVNLPALAGIGGVEYVEAIPQIRSMQMNLDFDVPQVATLAGDFTDLTGFESGTRVMNFEAAWSAGYTGAGQIVGVADTGLDTGNTGPLSLDFLNAISKGFIVGIGGKDWNDSMGHGTHVAGSIAGRGGKSGTAIRGGAYEARLVPMSMWSPILLEP